MTESTLIIRFQWNSGTDVKNVHPTPLTACLSFRALPSCLHKPTDRHATSPGLVVFLLLWVLWGRGRCVIVSLWSDWDVQLARKHLETVCQNAGVQVFFCTSVKECGERCEQVSNFSKSVKNQTQGHLVARRKYCQLCVLASLMLMPTHQCSGSRCVGHRTQQRLVAAKLSLKWKYNLNKQVCSFQRRYFAEAQKPQKWLIIIISHHKSTNVKKCTVKTLNKPVRFNYHTR